MTNASAIYLNELPSAPVQDEAKGNRFLITMVALAVLDLFLLMVVLKPWAQPARVHAVSDEIAAASVDKPSALGPVALKKPAAVAKARAAVAK